MSRDLVDCGECRTQGCLAGQCRNAQHAPATSEASRVCPSPSFQRLPADDTEGGEA